VRNKKKTHEFQILILLTLASLLLVCLGVSFGITPLAESVFGVCNPQLSPLQRISYGIELLLHTSEIISPVNVNGTEQLFIVEEGESVSSIADRLEAAGLIPNARTFRLYLAWTGIDTTIQSGTFRISAASPPKSIATMLRSTSMAEVTFSVLPGWRLEEIAAALPTSGLSITPDEFIRGASDSRNFILPLPDGATAEGFLFPDTYLISRSTTTEQLINVLMQGFISSLPGDYPSIYAANGLTVFQAVTLASIIEREVVADDEMALIASVFYNRLAINMKLQTDPTVQYALGFNTFQSTWWTSPLSAQDLDYDSPYNTYLYPGLPPGPISNPSLEALTAVAYPEQSGYYYFQAECDGSGRHNFSQTYEEHLQFNCP
jgi:UPF0755 protein